MQTNHKPQQLYPEKVFKIMSSLFLSNLKLQFSNRRPEKEMCDEQGCEGLELIGFAAIMQHF